MAVRRETISLAFLAALQVLPPRQRAANSALQRARATMQARLPPARGEWSAGEPTAEERELVGQFIAAHERFDAVTPLREGGSLPAIVEADNLGTYVMKFRGAGQGPLALVAEIIAGELARRLGLRVPELVLAELDPRIPGSEPDPEIQDLLRASQGLLREVTGLVPPGWFGDRGAGAYVEHLLRRAPIVPEVIRG